MKNVKVETKNADTIESHKLYGPMATILLTIGIYLTAQLVAGILLSIVPLVRNWEEARVTDWLENNVWAISSYLALVAAVTLWMVRMLLKKRGANFINIGLNKFQLKYVGYALSGFMVYFILYILGRVLTDALIPGINVDQEQDVGFKAGMQGPALLLVFVCLVIFPPLTEEIVMRGFLYGGLRAKLSMPAATLITSFIFGAAHLGGGKEGLLWIAAIDTFILSLVLCYLREKTNSLWPPIFLHMIKNAIAFSVLFIFIS